MNAFSPLIIVIAVFWLPSGARAEAFQSVDPPDARYALPFGVRDGTVVGLYQDVQGQHHGFEFTRRGAYASFDAPGADPQLGTYAIGLDSRGDIVGYFYDTAATPRGFVRSPGGQIITFDARGANRQGTFVWAVNRSGTVVGTYVDHAGVMRGFARNANGEQRPINLRSAHMVQPSGINDKGVIVGYFGDQTGFHGFVRENGEREDFESFDPPAGCTFDRYYRVYVNNRGDVVTTCVGYSSSSSHGYLRSRAGQVTVVDYPGTRYTSIDGITQTGDIVGVYLDLVGTTHGFVRSPDGAFAAFDFPGSAITTVFGSDPAGDIVGTYRGNSGPEHGYVRFASQPASPEQDD